MKLTNKHNTYAKVFFCKSNEQLYEQLHKHKLKETNFSALYLSKFAQYFVIVCTQQLYFLLQNL